MVGALPNLILHDTHEIGNRSPTGTQPPSLARQRTTWVGQIVGRSQHVGQSVDRLKHHIREMISNQIVRGGQDNDLSMRTLII